MDIIPMKKKKQGEVPRHPAQDSAQNQYGSERMAEKRSQTQQTVSDTPSTDTGRWGGIFDAILKGVLVLSVFLVPLFYFSAQDVTGFSKAILVSLLASVALAAWAARTIAVGEITWRRSWLAVPALAFAVVAFVSALFSSSFWVSVLGADGRYSMSVVSIVSYLVLFVVALSVLRRADIGWMAIALVASAGVASVAWILHLFEVFILPGDFTLDQFFTPLGSVFALAMFASVVLPLTIALAQTVSQTWARILLGVIGLLQFAVLLLVNLPAAWLALAVGMLVFAGVQMMAVKKESGAPWQGGVALPILGFVVAVLLWALPGLLGFGVQNMPSEISPTQSASVEVARGALSEDVLLGSGPETYPYVYAQYKSAELNETNFWGTNFSRGSSEFLTTVATLGVLGTLAWLSFVILFAIIALRRIRSGVSLTGVGLLSAWAAIVAATLFYSLSMSLVLLFWLIPALFIVLTASRDTAWSYQFRSGSLGTLLAFVSAIVLLVVSLGGAYLTVQRWSAERAFVQAFFIPNTEEARDELVETVARAVQRNPVETRYWRAFGQVLIARADDLIVELDGLPAPAPGEAQQFSPIPADVEDDGSDLFDGIEDEETGFVPTARAQEEADGIFPADDLQQQPTAPATEAEQLAELVQLHLVEAINALNRAYELDPRNTAVLVDVAEGFSALGAIVEGGYERAIEIYEEAVAFEPINPFLRTQLAQVHLVAGGFFAQDGSQPQAMRVTQAREQLERAIELNPRYSNARYFFGLILDDEGDRQSALAEFRIIAQLNPGNELIEFIVGNLEAGRPALAPPPVGDPSGLPIGGEEAIGVPGDVSAGEPTETPLTIEEEE